MPVMKLAAVSLAVFRPNKASNATAGRVASPPPMMKPAAAAIAAEGSGLSRIDFSICSRSSLIPNRSRYVRVCFSQRCPPFSRRPWSDSLIHPYRVRLRSVGPCLVASYWIYTNAKGEEELPDLCLTRRGLRRFLLLTRYHLVPMHCCYASSAPGLRTTLMHPSSLSRNVL
jgi:hypothetical protein